VRFLDGAGAWRNNIEISQALAGLPLSRFSLAQGADGSLELFLPDGVGCGDEAAGVVAALLGRAVVRRALVADDKVLAYASGMR
jgi:phenylacetate-CoA ligase